MIRTEFVSVEFYCAECEAEQQFEQPECLDEHGGDCPDWACVVCGFAVFTGPFPLAAAVAVQHRAA